MSAETKNFLKKRFKIDNSFRVNFLISECLIMLHLYMVLALGLYVHEICHIFGPPHFGTLALKKSCENEMFKFNRQIFHLRFFVYKIIVFEVNMKANSDSKFSIKNNESNFKGNVL